ncbi:TetR family transcriptional regulator C-terminal domain-containing protein [Nocardioides eburneiflavus]|uniref:TetR family transcriptional regulator C-terminal domain-containing protein n=1 Tax=Nocardioides eburneiflavus TaxID=2518372 RepID=UPI001FE98B4D|nr:TetR family transcriptional regulator C-terminal domain-containing protein [Nocardioides eburneiflavus]
MAAAFAHATNGESQILFPADDTRSVDRRVVTLLDGVLSPDAADFSRLWMSARIVSRHNAALRAVVTAQEETNRHQLIQLIRAGVEGGTFACTTIERSALLIFILLDATTTYVNKDVTEVTDLVGTLLFDTTERELGVPAGTLRSLSAQLAPAGLAATTSP